jgi:DUF1365 family protein
MVGTCSAIYTGSVIHRRFRPVAHTLRANLFTLLLDLDDVPRLDATLRWFSRGRANIMSWRPEDHLSGGSDLRGEVDGILATAGLNPAGGSVRLLTMPRVLGYAFNPICVYLCYQSSGALHAVLYEVNNTFGDRHSYLFPVAWEPGTSVSLRHGCAKVLHVSPFNDMDLRYDFRLRPPAASFGLRIDVADRAGPLMVAAERLRRRPFTDREIVRGVLEFPLLGLSVLGGIHLEALKLWRKGLGIRRRPPPPRDAVTMGEAG